MFKVYLMGSRKGRGRKGGRKSESKVDEGALREAVEVALRRPRLAFYSPVASVVLNYWKSVVPRFSMSEVLAAIVERELSRRWPNLYKRAREILESESAKSRKRKVGRK